MMQFMNETTTRQYKAPQKVYKTTLIAIYLITLSVFLGLFFGSSLFAQGSRLVTVHVDDQEFSIRTDVDTVGEAVERVGVELNEGDLIEPIATQKLESDNFHINVFRARNVTIIDGDEETSVLTAHQSPELVAEQAGIEIFDEDILSYDRVEDFVSTEQVGLLLLIDRAHEITLDLFGSESIVRTQADTVAQYIEQNDIEITDEVEVSPGLDASIADGDSITLIRNGLQLVTEEEPIAFGTEVINDSSRDIGTEEVRTPGVAGTELVTYEIELENGEEVSRSQVQSIVTKEPRDQVVVRGTKAIPPPTAANISGTKEDWLRAAGIPENQWSAVDFIVSRESSWNPNAVNPSSGACGLGQQLPCGKWDSFGAWNDPVAALRAQHDYVNRRYGGYPGAVAFWQVNNWY